MNRHIPRIPPQPRSCAIELSVHGAADHINLLEALVRPNDEHFDHDSDILAELLIPDGPEWYGEERKRLTWEGGRNAVCAGIAYLYGSGEPRTFAKLLEHIDDCLREMLARRPDMNALVGELARHINCRLAWIAGAGDAPLANASDSTFDLADVVAGKVDVRIAFSDRERDYYAPWLRLFEAAPAILAQRFGGPQAASAAHARGSA
jgi:hypothetical protein